MLCKPSCLSLGRHLSYQCGQVACQPIRRKLPEDVGIWMDFAQLNKHLKHICFLDVGAGMQKAAASLMYVSSSPFGALDFSYIRETL